MFSLVLLLVAFANIVNGQSSLRGDRTLLVSQLNQVVFAVGQKVGDLLAPAGQVVGLSGFTYSPGVSATLPGVVASASLATTPLGVGLANAIPSGAIGGVVLDLTQAINSGASSITLILASPAQTAFNILASAQSGQIGTGIVSGVVNQALSTATGVLPISAIPLVGSLPLLPAILPTAGSLYSVLSSILSVLKSLVNTLLSPVTGILGGLLSSTVSASAYQSTSITIPLSAATSFLSIVSNSNIVDVLGATLNF